MHLRSKEPWKKRPSWFFEMSSHHFSFERRCNPSCALLWKMDTKMQWRVCLQLGQRFREREKTGPKYMKPQLLGAILLCFLDEEVFRFQQTNNNEFLCFFEVLLEQFGIKMSRVTRFAKSVDGFPSLELLSNHGLLLDAKDSSGGGYWDVPGESRNGATVPCRLVSALKCCFCVIA